MICMRGFVVMMFVILQMAKEHFARGEDCIWENIKRLLDLNFNNFDKGYMMDSDLKKSMQKAFNKTYLGLASQGWFRSFDGNVCLYKNTEGFKCAIGHLCDIPSNILYGVQSSSNGGTLVRERLEEAGFLSKDEVYHTTGPMIDFLGNMQKAHDSSRTPEQMKRTFDDMAETFDLDNPSLM